jgi:hypothetical protein
MEKGQQKERTQGPLHSTTITTLLTVSRFPLKIKHFLLIFKENPRKRWQNRSARRAPVTFIENSLKVIQVLFRSL